MGRNRLVSPESVRVPLSDGDFLTVKRELSAGEYLDCLQDGAAGNRFADWIAYLVGWSLVGPHDAPIPYAPSMSVDERRDTLRSLDVATIVEIDVAIKAHVAANERAVQEKKTTPALVGVS